MKKKYIYFFGSKSADGNAKMKDLLGGKGANLAEMANLGFPVPSGFTITTQACNEYNHNNNKYPTGLQSEIDRNLSRAMSITTIIINIQQDFKVKLIEISLALSVKWAPN